ncbi:hypothetical protein ScPMuIL_005903 [Solemya velum]
MRTFADYKEEFQKMNMGRLMENNVLSSVSKGDLYETKDREKPPEAEYRQHAHSSSDHLRKAIIEKYRPNADAKSLRCGNNVRFSELVKYIIDGVKSGQLNEHFTPYHENCLPCEIKYDFIGKIETHANDMEYIWKMANETKEIFGHLPDLHGASMANINEKVDFVYRYKHLYSKCTNSFEAMQITWETLQMRGIIGKNISFPYNNGDEVKKEIFRDKVHEAYRNSGRKEFRRQHRDAVLSDFYRPMEVPMEDLLQLQDILRTDCEMFGYDPAPKQIFDRIVTR